MMKSAKRACAALAALAFILVVGGFTREMATQIRLGPDLQQELGFRLGSPYIFVNGRGVEVMGLNAVQPGGAFAQAGFRTGDIFIERRSIGELYSLLEASRGKRVTLCVVPGGNGPPLDQRPVRSITFSMPQEKRSGQHGTTPR